MTTRIRLIIISLLIAILPMILIGILSFYNSRQLVTSETLNKLEAVATIQEARVVEVVEASVEKVDSFSKDSELFTRLLSFINTGGGEDRLWLDGHLINLSKDNKEFDKIFILDSFGTALVSTDENLLGSDFSQSDFFLIGKEKSKLFTTKLLDENGRPILYISAPIIADSRIVGVLVTQYQL